MAIRIIVWLFTPKHLHSSLVWSLFKPSFSGLSTRTLSCASMCPRKQPNKLLDRRAIVSFFSRRTKISLLTKQVHFRQSFKERGRGSACKSKSWCCTAWVQRGIFWLTINSKLNTRASVSYSLTDREKLEMSLYAVFTPSLKLMIATRTGHTKSKLCCFDKSVHKGLEQGHTVSNKILLLRCGRIKPEGSSHETSANFVFLLHW